MERRGSQRISVRKSEKSVRIYSKDVYDKAPHRNKISNDNFASLKEARDKLDSEEKMYGRFYSLYGKLSLTEMGFTLLGSIRSLADLINNTESKVDIYHTLGFFLILGVTLVAMELSHENQIKNHNKALAVREAGKEESDYFHKDYNF